MDINDAKDLKKDVEISVLRLLINFEQITGLSIRDVDMFSSESHGGGKEIVYFNIRVEL
jgi:hypothetical protein